MYTSPRCRWHRGLVCVPTPPPYNTAIGTIPSPPPAYRSPHIAHCTRTPSGTRDRSGSFSPHWHTHPTSRAGTPTTIAYAGTSRVTTAPAPTKQYSPSVFPHTIVAFAPIEAPLRTSVSRYSFLRDTWLRGL